MAPLVTGLLAAMWKAAGSSSSVVRERKKASTWLQWVLVAQWLECWAAVWKGAGSSSCLVRFSTSASTILTVRCYCGQTLGLKFNVQHSAVYGLYNVANDSYLQIVLL